MIDHVPALAGTEGSPPPSSEPSLSRPSTCPREPPWAPSPPPASLQPSCSSVHAWRVRERGAELVIPDSGYIVTLIMLSILVLRSQIRNQQVNVSRHALCRPILCMHRHHVGLYESSHFRRQGPLPSPPLPLLSARPHSRLPNWCHCTHHRPRFSLDYTEGPPEPSLLS